MIKIRLMRKNDRPFLDNMVTTVGWNQIEKDWDRYIDMEPRGCFVAEFNGLPVGTATTISYEDRIGWIGMVIVSPIARGRGIGTALLKRCIDYLSPTVQTIKLDATPLGEPVYRKLGFEKECNIVRMEATAKPANETILPCISNRNKSKIIAFDKMSFGASREKVLVRLINEYPDYSAFIEKDGQILGYALANKGRRQWHIGPVVVNSISHLNILLSSIMTKLVFKNVYMDVPVFSDERFCILKNFGFKDVRSYTRMYLGENPNSGKLDKIFATARAEKG